MNPDLISEPIEFEWDEWNIRKSLDKHGIEPEEAEDVFYHEPVIWLDEKHSISEKRYQCLGQTSEKKKLFVSFTLRNDKVRIISVRPMSRKERIVYEKT